MRKIINLQEKGIEETAQKLLLILTAVVTIEFVIIQFLLSHPEYGVRNTDFVEPPGTVFTHTSNPSFVISPVVI